jgi:hypothetical protein
MSVMDSDQTLKTLETMIRSADKRMRELDRDYELIPKLALPELVRKKTEIDIWTCRRRTLIQVWELMTDKVWITQAAARR